MHCCFLRLKSPKIVNDVFNVLSTYHLTTNAKAPIRNLIRLRTRCGK